jgi:hypothetical protein
LDSPGATSHQLETFPRIYLLIIALEVAIGREVRVPRNVEWRLVVDVDFDVVDHGEGGGDCLMCGESEVGGVAGYRMHSMVLLYTVEVPRSWMPSTVGL